MILCGKNRSADRQRKWLLFFLAGFVLGVLYVLLLGRAESGNMLMSRYFFSKYQYVDYRAGDLFWYIWQTRVTRLTLLWLLGITVIGSAVLLLFSLWGGFSFGLILTMAVLKFRMAGILLCLVSMFPHYLLYVPVMVFSMKKIEGASGKRRPSRAYILSCALSLLVTTGGIFLESYVNPLLLKMIVKKL